MRSARASPSPGPPSRSAATYTTSPLSPAGPRRHRRCAGCSPGYEPAWCPARFPGVAGAGALAAVTDADPEGHRSARTRLASMPAARTSAWRRPEGGHAGGTGPAGGNLSRGVVMVFADRDDAGRRLAARLGHLRGEPGVVLGLPRGGIPVAFQVARALGAPLDVIVVRKLGVPFRPELGMGAVGEGGVRVTSPEVIHAAGVSQNQLAAVQAREQAVVDARAACYRARRPREPLDGRVAVVVDDGIATGSTARAACQIARAAGAARVVLAVPVAPAGWQARIGADADELACVGTPRGF